MITNNKQQYLPETIDHDAHEYIYAMHSLTERVKALSDTTLSEDQRPLSETELRDVVLELISISQNVKNIVFFTNLYLQSERVDMSTVGALRESVTTSIAEIKTHVRHIKSYVETCRSAAPFESIRYN